MKMAAKEEKKEMHPVWRGIGCVTIVFVLMASFFLSSWFIDYMTSCRPVPISTWFTDGSPEQKPQVPGCDTPPTLPRQISFLPSALRGMTTNFKLQFPWFGGMGRYVPPVLISLVTALLMFGLISMAYAFVRGDANDPRDVRKLDAPGPKKRKVRRCR
jgi:hypothetical protein